MAISIDQAVATEILLFESEAAASGNLPAVAVQWQDHVQKLGQLCPHRKSATTIAALGTAILAKATDDRVDVYSLLDRGEAATSYSARTLADNVWAKTRARLEVDLGANGTNPLNNAPFLGKTRIDQISGVRNKEGWAWFLRCMELLEALPDSENARLALRGFIAARRRGLLPVLRVDSQLGDRLSMSRLACLIGDYVAAESEGGRRAQACAAGILDAVFGPNRVVVGVINDPDRRAPLDISIRDHASGFEMAFEVKDKPITDIHVQASIEKTAVDHGTANLVFLAVGVRQLDIDFSRVLLWAAERGVRATVIDDWHALLTACRCFAPSQNVFFEGSVLRSIISRASELGVHPEALEALIEKAKK